MGILLGVLVLGLTLAAGFQYDVVPGCRFSASERIKYNMTDLCSPPAKSTTLLLERLQLGEFIRINEGHSHYDILINEWWGWYDPDAPAAMDEGKFKDLWVPEIMWHFAIRAPHVISKRVFYDARERLGIDGRLHKTNMRMNFLRRFTIAARGIYDTHEADQWETKWYPFDDLKMTMQGHLHSLPGAYTVVMQDNFRSPNAKNDLTVEQLALALGNRFVPVEPPYGRQRRTSVERCSSAANLHCRQTIWILYCA
jgi:hypothetical protein